MVIVKRLGKPFGFPQGVESPFGFSQWYQHNGEVEAEIDEIFPVN